MGCQALLQGIFSTQGLNKGFLHCRRILYQLSYQGSLVVKTRLQMKTVEQAKLVPMSLFLSLFYLGRAFLSFNILMLFWA